MEIIAACVHFITIFVLQPDARATNKRGSGGGDDDSLPKTVSWCLLITMKTANLIGKDASVSSDQIYGISERGGRTSHV